MGIPAVCFTGTLRVDHHREASTGWRGAITGPVWCPLRLRRRGICNHLSRSAGIWTKVRYQCSEAGRKSWVLYDRVDRVSVHRSEVARCIQGALIVRRRVVWRRVVWRQVVLVTVCRSVLDIHIGHLELDRCSGLSVSIVPLEGGSSWCLLWCGRRICLNRTMSLVWGLGPVAPKLAIIA